MAMAACSLVGGDRSVGGGEGERRGVARPKKDPRQKASPRGAIMACGAAATAGVGDGSGGGGGSDDADSAPSNTEDSLVDM